MRQILLMILAAAAVDGGAITSGSIDFPNGGFGASLSGANFSAGIGDGDGQDWDPWGDGVSIPSPVPVAGCLCEAGSGGDAGNSGVTYDGVFYWWGGDFFEGPPAGTPIATTLSFEITLKSPDQVITGPGTYPQTYAVQLSFCVSASRDSPAFHCETDEGTAMGAWTATEGNAIFDFLPGGLDLTVMPEPSTLSYVGFALCFVARMAMKRRRNVRTGYWTSGLVS